MIHEKLKLLYIASIIFIFSVFAQNAFGQQDFDRNGFMKLLPHNTWIAMTARPALLTGDLRSFSKYNDILKIIKEVNIDKKDLSQYTFFMSELSSKNIVDKSFSILPFEGIGILLKGNFSNTNIDKLLFYEQYIGFDIYYVNALNTYLVKLTKDYLLISTNPLVIGDLIDVVKGRSLSLVNNKTHAIRKLSTKIMSNAPITLLAIQSEKLANLITYMKSLISFGKINIGYSHWFHFTITLDGSQIAKLGDYEGLVMNVNNLGYKKYVNLNILFSDALTASFFTGALNVPLLFSDDIQEMLFKNNDIEGLSTSSERELAIIDLIYSQ